MFQLTHRNALKDFFITEKSYFRCDPNAYARQFYSFTESEFQKIQGLRRVDTYSRPSTVLM